MCVEYEMDNTIAQPYPAYANNRCCRQQLALSSRLQSVVYTTHQGLASDSVIVLQDEEKRLQMTLMLLTHAPNLSRVMQFCTADLSSLELAFTVCYNCCNLALQQ